MAAKGEWKALEKAAKQAGWTVDTSRGGHLRWKSPTGKVIFSAATASDHRAVANHRSLLRKAGLAI